MDNTLIKSMVGSLVRTGLNAVAGALGLGAANGVTPEHMNSTAAFITAGIMAGGSLLWSYFAHKKNIETLPPGK